MINNKARRFGGLDFSLGSVVKRTRPTEPRIPGKGEAMSLYEKLSLLIALATLIVTLLK